MEPWIIALIAVLAVHYVLSIATIYLLMKDMGLVKAIIPWNLVILLLPVAGPVAYHIYRPIAKKKKKDARASAEDATDGHESR